MQERGRGWRLAALRGGAHCEAQAVCGNVAREQRRPEEVVVLAAGARDGEPEARLDQLAHRRAQQLPAWRLPHGRQQRIAAEEEEAADERRARPAEDHARGALCGREGLVEAEAVDDKGAVQPRAQVHPPAAARAVDKNVRRWRLEI